MKILSTATPLLAERRRIHIIVGQVLGLTAAYALLTGFFTRPLFWHWAEYTPAGGFSGDQCKTIWFFWWTKSALLDLQQTPFFTDTIYYPFGTGVGYHLCLLTNLIAVGVSQLIGVAINSPLLYNLMLSLSFVLTGIASFLLIRMITGRAGVSFLASLFVTFAPYRLWHLDHLNLLSAQWGILAAVCAISFLRNPRRLALFGAVVFIVASFYADLTNVMVTILFLAVYAVLFWRRIWEHPQRKRILVGAGIGVVVAMILVAPGLFSLGDAQSEWLLGWQGSERYSADLTGFLLPTSGDLVTGRGEVYLGWLFLGMAVVAIGYFRNSEVRKWAIAAGVFLVLSLGPTLLIAGNRLLPGLMPNRWLFETIPYFDLSRAPARLIVGAQLCLAVLAAFALDGWFAGLRRQITARWYLPAAVVAGGVIVAGICLEYSAGPIPLVPMDVPAAYEELAGDTSIDVVCDIPMYDKLQISNWYMYWQTFHGCKTANGYLAHHSKDAVPLLDRIKSWDEIGIREITELRAMGIDAIIYHQPDQPSQLIHLADIDESVTLSSR